MNIKLRTISKVASNVKTILNSKTAEALPIMKGKGDINLLCGNCGPFWFKASTEDKCGASPYTA